MRFPAFFIAGLLVLLQVSEPVSARTEIDFSGRVPDMGNLVLGVWSGGDTGKFGQTVDRRSDGGLTYIIRTISFGAQPGTSRVIPAPQGSGLDQILLVGLGERSQPLSNRDLQDIGGQAVQDATKAFGIAPTMAFDVPARDLAHIAYGAKLGSYYFDRYFTVSGRPAAQSSLRIIGNDTSDARRFFRAELDPVADAMWMARDISNEPANVIYPQTFVARWQDHFSGMNNLTIRVIDEQEMQQRGMGAIYGVGRGSKRPPRLMIVEYKGGTPGDKPVVIVGKGITFDTGGISIKPTDKMWNMKFDMSGAASAMGTIHALAGRGAKVNAVGIAALAENMPGGDAQRPGDVVKSMSGKTIQIRSTDAEGRLVLADAMYLADTTYDPALLVDLATLTGSARRALGGDFAALFTRHDDLVVPFRAAGAASGDEVWHMPLIDAHFKAVENDVADVMNSSNGAPGASAGAAFIGTFVRESTPWVHLDIAGIAYDDKPSPTKASPGSRAYGVRLLNEYIRTHFEE